MSRGSSAAQWEPCVRAFTTRNGHSLSFSKGSTNVNDNDLGEALLKLGAVDLAAVPEARAQARRVLDRDHRRIRMWTALTVAVWLIGVVMILSALVSYGLVMPRQALLFQLVDAGKIDAAQREVMQREIVVQTLMSTVLIGFSVAIMGLAALGAMRLLFASRRATLRQMNLNLIEITEQLKQLRAARSSNPPGPAPTPS